MQVMFLRQHFGSLAIGLSNADEAYNHKLSRMEERDNPWERQRFFEVSDGGVSHPWSDKQCEFRVAITADGLTFYPDRLDCPPSRVFAKVEFQVTGEVYLAYKRPYSTISYGLPGPSQMANEIIVIAARKIGGHGPFPDDNWVVVDKPQVPVYHRSLLGKVMSRVQNAINQGADFFKNPKSH